ncbi:MFS transporter [Rhodococcus sp. NPDC127530]|uniref:MFS transporter n=1 Tax=Rhodococcus sp. NPDC127530 TaxID=3345397 RepID=UPI0036285494
MTQWALTSTLPFAAATTPISADSEWALRRPTILAGLVMVSIGTVLSAVAPNFPVLVIGRALQGVSIALTRWHGNYADEAPVGQP